MATKYIIFGYNFDHGMRGWIKPEFVDGCHEADDRMYEMWEDYQNEFVIGGWDDDDEGYMENNFHEEDGAGSVAWSRIRGSEGPFVIAAEPCGRNYLILHAYENEMGSGIETLNQTMTERGALKLIFDDMMVRIDDMDAPQAIVEGDNMTVYDSMGFDEHYYQIVDAR